MAEADPLQRIKSAALRSEGPVSVETQRRRHFDELNQDLGLDAETQRRRARASQPSRLPSLTRIIAYLMLFSILLIIASNAARRSGVIHARASASRSGVTLTIFGDFFVIGLPEAIHLGSGLID